MKKSLLILLVLSFSSAQSGSCRDLGHIPGMFLNIGFGARARSMGGAFSALSDDAYAVIWNPAGLTQLQYREASFFSTRLLQLIPYHMAVYAHHPHRSRWAHSEAVIVSGDDALREMTLLTGGGYRLRPGLRIGASLKLKNATFGNNSEGGEGRVTGSAIGAGLDLGVLIEPARRVALALVLRDLFDAVSWSSSALGTYTQGNPVQLIAGALVRPWSRTAVAVDLEKSVHRDTDDHVRFGVERGLFGFFSLRGGLSQRLEPAAPLEAHFGCGAALLLQNLQMRIDLAYSLLELHDTVAFSIGLSF